jgi:dTDP-4-dehydrorhamnose reductase
MRRRSGSWSATGSDVTEPRRVGLVITGGQSGVDTAAQEVAVDLGIPVGGWCPAGRRAEHGRIPDDVPLRETPSRDPAVRTRWNVHDADATLLLVDGAPNGGTALAERTARALGRPLLVVPPDRGSIAAIAEWVSSLPVGARLNVGGPRESESPGIRDRAATTLGLALADAAVGGTSEPERVLVTGGAGLLGGALLRLRPPGVVASSTWRRSPAPPPTHRIDLADPSATRALLATLRPSLVLHTAYGTVDPERDIVRASENVAAAAFAVGARLIHLSSDTVLGGEHAPYDEDAASAPVSDYGRWKATAEDRVREAHPGADIIRTSLIVELDPPDPRTEWVLGGLRGAERVTLFHDELRSPIVVDDLARQIWEIDRVPGARRGGIWNLAGPEALSRYTIGLLVAALFGEDALRLTAGDSATSPTPRPRDLRLLTRRADVELLTRARSIGAAVADALNNRSNRTR